MRAGRWLVAIALLAGCTSTATGPSAPSPGRTGETPVPASPTVGAPSASPTVDPLAEARRRLTDVEAAAATDPVGLRVAVATAMRDDLDGLVAEAWEDRVLEGLPGWPVTTGRARIADGAVELDVVIAAPPDDDGQLVLRWLPAAQALGDAVASTAVEVDGAPVEVETDAAGARLLVPVDPGEDHLVRVTAAYTVPDRDRIVDDGSPAGYGLLARTPTATMLGHWLPLVALPSDDGPMQARGDVGAFPPAAFSLLVEHPGTLVTGGAERPCPTAARRVHLGAGHRGAGPLGGRAGRRGPGRGVTAWWCTPRPGPSRGWTPWRTRPRPGWRRSTTPSARCPGLRWTSWLPPCHPGRLAWSSPAWSGWIPGRGPRPGRSSGPTCWPTSWATSGSTPWSATGPCPRPWSTSPWPSTSRWSCSTAGSATGPGTPSRTARWAAGTTGPIGQGVTDEAPAQPLAAFASAESYGADVYGRGGQAWVDAEDAAGRDEVLDALATLVARYGLRQVDPELVLDIVREVAPDAAPTLADGWGSRPRRVDAGGAPRRVTRSGYRRGMSNTTPTLPDGPIAPGPAADAADARG